MCARRDWGAGRRLRPGTAGGGRGRCRAFEGFPSGPVYPRRRASEPGSSRRRRPGEALGKGGAGPAGVVEAVGLAGGTDLVAAEDAEEAWDLEFARVDEGADLVVLPRPLGDGDPELAAESDQAVAGEDF